MGLCQRRLPRRSPILIIRELSDRDIASVCPAGVKLGWIRESGLPPTTSTCAGAWCSGRRGLPWVRTVYYPTERSLSVSAGHEFRPWPVPWGVVGHTAESVHNHNDVNIADLTSR